MDLGKTPCIRKSPLGEEGIIDKAELNLTDALCIMKSPLKKEATVDKALLMRVSLLMGRLL